MVTVGPFALLRNWKCRIKKIHIDRYKIENSKKCGKASDIKVRLGSVRGHKGAYDSASASFLRLLTPRTERIVLFKDYSECHIGFTIHYVWFNLLFTHYFSFYH